MSHNIGRNEHLKRLHEQWITAQKQRQKLAKEDLKIKQKHLTESEELEQLEEEITLYDTALQKKQLELAEQQKQVTKVEVCRRVEQVRTEARLSVIQEHREQFNKLFAREMHLAEQRYQQQCERERQELERERARDSELARQNQELLEAAVSVEAECDQLDRECAVLKKRNKAILLLLRKNLCDAETRRRNLIRQRQ